MNRDAARLIGKDQPEQGEVWMVALFRPGERPCATSACVITQVDAANGEYLVQAVGPAYEGQEFWRPLTRMQYVISASEKDWRNRVVLVAK